VAVRHIVFSYVSCLSWILRSKSRACFFIYNGAYSNLLITTSLLQLSVLHRLSDFPCSISSGFYIHAPSASEQFIVQEPWETFALESFWSTSYDMPPCELAKVIFTCVSEYWQHTWVSHGFTGTKHQSSLFGTKQPTFVIVSRGSSHIAFSYVTCLTRILRGKSRGCFLYVTALTPTF